MAPIKEIDQTATRKILRGLWIVVIWLVFSAVLNIFKFVNPINFELQNFLASVSMIDWIYFGSANFCAVGLVFKLNWARRLSILFFIAYFVWAILVVNHLSGPSFNHMVEYSSMAMILPTDMLKKLLIIFMVFYIIWPIVAILYLTYPTVKFHFDTSVKSDKM